MKRQRSSSANSRMAKKPRYQRQDATVTAVVRKELRKKTDWRYADYSLTATNVQNAGTVYSLYSNLVRGDGGLNNFDGNLIRPQAITMKYFIHTSTVRNAVRVLLFQWFDSATPVTTGILQTNTSGLATIAPTLVTNKAYIKVLYDRTHQFAPTASHGDNGGNTVIDGEGVTDPVTVYIPGKRLRVTKYNSSTNVVQEGNLYLLLISDDAVIPSPQITLYSRVTFSDD